MSLLSIFNFLDATTGIKTNICDNTDLKWIFQVARLAIKVIQIAVPFALILWGSIDFFKAVIAGDEKEMKAKRRPFIQRLIAAIIVLLLPIIVNVIIKTIANTQQATWAKCWNAGDNNAGNDITIPNSDENFGSPTNAPAQ